MGALACHKNPPSHTPCSYGYATNSRMKLIIVTENYGSQTKDQEMKQVCNEYHKYLVTVAKG